MWSIYDTMLLITGLVVLVIAFVPVAGIPAATRLWSGVIGGGLVLLALFLGSLHWFRYPSAVFAGPVIAALALGGVIADARRRTNPDQAQLPHDQLASGPMPVEPDVPSESAPPALVVPEPVTLGDSGSQVAVDSRRDPRDRAWAEVNDPDTPAERLAEIAASHPEFGTRMLGHPNLYPALEQWIRELPAE